MESDHSDNNSDFQIIHGEKSTCLWPCCVQEALSKQVNLELHASYVYLMLSTHFGRGDVALKNVAKYFKECSEEERGHADGLMQHNTKRGGTTTFQPVNPAGVCMEPGKFTVLQAMQMALELEQQVYTNLLALHDSARNDPEFTDLIAGQYLREQVNGIHELNGYIANLERVGDDGMGEYLFDKHFRD